MRDVFEYALLRVIPRLERGEAINAGVILYCQPRSYLAAHCHLDTERLRALDPDADIDGVRRALHAVELVCRAAEDAGPTRHEDAGRRFRWLTAPRSTIVQPGPIHTGLTDDPDAEARRLLELLVHHPTTQRPAHR
ncbi:hypothetical protein HDA32_002771 [Spinactinospora alkalitolerans]|uniref:DUF3037 domain-containing protein n=1 Tax=Spinactinospora alkalitolerans TaxID=687207 RepID=A0A852TVC7_9ACTN|nr:DUF3037 domain-containing protein [Spinactinospora alkalitolerans]NYE47651.1 hypothetical protein [Spinactinospora alkalitolerans]